jgi:hypothetical protein
MRNGAACTSLKNQLWTELGAFDCPAAKASITINGSMWLGVTHFSRQNFCRRRNYRKRTGVIAANTAIKLHAALLKLSRNIRSRL